MLEKEGSSERYNGRGRERERERTYCEGAIRERIGERVERGRREEAQRGRECERRKEGGENHRKEGGRKKNYLLICLFFPIIIEQY